jgi:hypothetical protein
MYNTLCVESLNTGSLYNSSGAQNIVTISKPVFPLTIYFVLIGYLFDRASLVMMAKKRTD